MALTRLSSTHTIRLRRPGRCPSFRALSSAACCLFAFTLSPSAQPIDGLPIGPALHPDGAVGHPAISVAARYLSEYTDNTSGGFDHQIYHAGFAFVPTGRLTLRAEYSFIDRFHSSHLVLGGFDLYVRNPLSSPRAVNADGPVGAPVLRALAGARIPSDTDSLVTATADIRLTLPAGRRLSLAAGYRWHEEESSDDPLDFYGTLALYFASYRADSAWANPDGPVGFPALRLTGGAGENAWSITAQVLVPLQPELTLTGSLAVDRFTDPTQTRYSAELGFAWYHRR